MGNSRSLRAVFTSARPNTWLRIWGEMVVPAAMAVYLGARGSLGAFLLAFVATSPLLWTAGYLLNDWTDRDLDRGHGLRKMRPMASGVLTSRDAVRAMGLAAGLALMLGAFLGPRVLGCLALLGASQSCYTLRPMRWKERPGLDMASNGLNSVLRSAIAWYSQTGAPLSWIGFMVGALASAKLALFLGHRFQNRAFERSRGIRSTVTVLSPGMVLGCIGLATLGTGAMLTEGVLSGRFPWVALVAGLFGALPLLVFLARGRGTPSLLVQESNAALRNALYLSIFLVGSLVAGVLVAHPAAGHHHLGLSLRGSL